VTCYHMLSGKPPFNGKSAREVEMAHVLRNPQPLQELRDDLPVILCRIVHKMMAKSPEKRYQRATELLRDLKRFQHRQSGRKGSDDEEVDDSPRDLDRAAPPPLAGPFWKRWGISIWRAPDRSMFGYALRVFGLGLLVAGASAGIGWLLRTADPFATEPRRVATVDNLGSADRQYFHAMTLGDSIPAWKAVIENFPDKQFYRNYALQQLATLHLARGEFGEASTCFDQLAALPSAEAKFRAFGRAGQAILLQHLRHDPRGSQEQIAQLAGSFDLLDPWMQEQVADTIERNRSQLREELSAALRTILEKRPSQNEP